MYFLLHGDETNDLDKLKHLDDARQDMRCGAGEGGTLRAPSHTAYQAHLQRSHPVKTAAVPVVVVVACPYARPGALLHPSVHERVEREHLRRRLQVVIEHHAQLRREQALATRLFDVRQSGGPVYA